MSSFVWTGTTDTGFATAGNWTPSGPPSTSGDTAQFDWNSPTNGVAASNQSATTLALLNFTSFFTLTVGAAGAPLQIGATVLTVGGAAFNSGAGSGRINLDLGSVASAIYVYSTGSSVDTGLEPLRIQGTSASNKAYVLGGTVGFATDSLGALCTLSSLEVSGQNTTVNLSANVTWTGIYQTGGQVSINSGGTTIEQSGGVFVTAGIGAVTNMTVGGNAILNQRAASGATITNLVVMPGGTADFSQLSSNVTVTNLTIYGSGKVIFNAANPAHLIITNPIVFVDASTILGQ